MSLIYRIQVSGFSMVVWATLSLIYRILVSGFSMVVWAALSLIYRILVSGFSMVVWAGIENPNGKFSSESNHPATDSLDWDCRFLDRSMFVADLTLPDWIQYDDESGTYLVIPDGGDRAVAELVISHRAGERWYFLYEVHLQYTEDGEVSVGGDQIYSGTDWDQCLRDAADLLTAAEVRRGPVWTSGDSVWARVRRIGGSDCHWANLDWQDANDWELSGYQALHKYSLEILSTHSAAEMYAFEDQYCSHPDATSDSEAPELYPGIDPNEYSFLSWDSQNGVYWIQSPNSGTVGSLWVDYDWETPIYWVSRVDKHWDAIRGDWLLYDAGTVYSGDSFLQAIFNCLTLI